MISVFYIYDWMVSLKDKKLTMNAAETSKLVTNMFPGALRDKVLDQQRKGNIGINKGGWGFPSATSQIQTLAASNHEEIVIDESNPLAELYPGMLQEGRFRLCTCCFNAALSHICF